MAWHADVKWVASDDPDNAPNDRLAVTWRGRVEEGAARSVRGGLAVRQQRSWSRSARSAVMPCHRSGCDVSAALAMAKLDGPLEALLMLVCCEDFSRWPEVERCAVAALRHPHGKEAATDAMHRIMWRRPVLSVAARAKGLRIRKDSYALLRRCAEGLLRAWLEDAAEDFLNALEGDVK